MSCRECLEPRIGDDGGSYAVHSATTRRRTETATLSHQESQHGAVRSSMCASMTNFWEPVTRIVSRRASRGRTPVRTHTGAVVVAAMLWVTCAVMVQAQPQRDAPHVRVVQLLEESGYRYTKETSWLWSVPFDGRKMAQVSVWVMTNDEELIIESVIVRSDQVARPPAAMRQLLLMNGAYGAPTFLLDKEGNYVARSRMILEELNGATFLSSLQTIVAATDDAYGAMKGLLSDGVTPRMVGGTTSFGTPSGATGSTFAQGVAPAPISVMTPVGAPSVASAHDSQPALVMVTKGSPLTVLDGSSDRYHGTFTGPEHGRSDGYIRIKHVAPVPVNTSRPTQVHVSVSDDTFEIQRTYRTLRADIRRRFAQSSLPTPPIGDARYRQGTETDDQPPSRFRY
jgi:hypothetical protein